MILKRCKRTLEFVLNRMIHIAIKLKSETGQLGPNRTKFSGMKRNLDSIISFVDSDPQYNKYYSKLRTMRQDVAKEQHEKGTQTKISSFCKNGFNNTKYAGCLN
jgi:hypothetical protein